MISTNTLVGVIFILSGLILLKYPPKKINSFYGYRTRHSKSTQKKWDFAQRYSAKELITQGAILLIIGIVGYILNIKELFEIGFGLVLILLSVILIFYKTEKAIKKIEE